MKGMRSKNAIVDSDSEDDADDLGIDQLTKSIRRVKLDDEDADDEFEMENEEEDDDKVILENVSMPTKAYTGVSSQGIPSTIRPPKHSVGTVSSLTGGSSDDEETDSEDDKILKSEDETVSSRSMKKATMTSSDEEEPESKDDKCSDSDDDEESSISVKESAKSYRVAKNSTSEVSDDSSVDDNDSFVDEAKTPEKPSQELPSAAKMQAPKVFDIFDDSSSSDSDDSLDFRRPSKSKSHVPKREIVTRPRKKTTNKYVGNGSDSSDSESEPASKAKTHKKQWAFNKIRSEYSFGGDGVMPPFSMPACLFEALYPFQREGVMWMAGLHMGKIGGCLGDDMGMGKTFMSLSLLGGLMRAKTIRKALVVAPVSVLRNWEREAQKILGMCVKAKIQVIASETSKYAREKRLKAAMEAQSPQLVITTLGLVSSAPDHFQHHRYAWDYIICDEAHRIKNPNAQVSQNIELIARRDETRRIILTGTPIMNNLKELHALFTFCTSAQVLGNYPDFRDKFGSPIEAARSSDATNWEVERGENAMRELQAILQPYFLQRLKVDYLAEALPPKKEYVLWTNLSPIQREKYNEYVSSKESGLADYLDGRSNSPLFAITWLQKLCGHPLLVQDVDDDPIQGLHEIDKEELLHQSAKLQVMYDLLHSLVENGHRILIFSQSTKVLDIIECVLKDTIQLGRIDGQTKEKDRQRFVDDFNDKPNIEAMLISTKAGGQGLTLVGADTVIVYDPSWNPAEDSQAVDRCYRIGQKKPVTVYRLITSGTVEEKRYEKQIHKDGLRRSILTSSGNDTAKYFTKEELVRRQVFVLGEEGKCEFLEKLEERGFNSLEDIDPDAIFSDGVIGQSSHDVVYSLPENWYEAAETKDATAPFSSPNTKGKWYETKNDKQKAVLGRSQRVLLKTEKNGGREVCDKENDGNDTNRDRSLIDKVVDGGPAQSKQSRMNFEEQMGRVKQLRASGEGVQAVATMMDMLDESYDALNSDEKMALHHEMAGTSSDLKWL